jgi:hypothetical protein
MRRNCFFHKDDTTRIEGRNTFCKHIDNVICASYGLDLCITHRCVNKDKSEELKTDIAENQFKEKEA